MTHKTVFDKDFKILESDKKFDYQPILTEKLDSDSSDFDQNKLNEIVLWKVNRYAHFKNQLIDELNSISPESAELDLVKTKNVLRLLLKTKGVKLAMASTILRFRNPNVYQIIDQRVYRIIYEGQELKLSNYSSEKNIDKQIKLYIKYLKDLKQISLNLNIPFEKSDRILFMTDRRINKDHKLKNY